MITFHKMEQRTLEWNEAKLGKLGASEIKDIVDARKKYKLKSLDTVLTKVAKVIAEIKTGFSQTSDYTSEAMEWGIDNEDNAINAVKLPTSFKVGGVTREDFKYFWLSPDLLSGEIAHEIKCFDSKNFAKIVITNQIPTANLPQCLAYFVMLDELKTMEFVLYDPRFQKKNIHKIILNRSDYEEEVDNMKESIKSFCDLVDKHLTKF